MHVINKELDVNSLSSYFFRRKKMATLFSTKSNHKIEDPLSRLNQTDMNPTFEPVETEQTFEQINMEPILVKPETELDVNDKSSILEYLIYNLNKLKIPHTIKTFGYHTKDDFITTEYAVIDETSKNTILIIHLTKKQVRYQVPSHQKENKKLSKFAKDFQKQLKYTWLEWF